VTSISFAVIIVPQMRPKSKKARVADKQHAHTPQLLRLDPAHQRQAGADAFLLNDAVLEHQGGLDVQRVAKLADQRIQPATHDQVLQVVRRAEDHLPGLEFLQGG